MVAGPGLAGWIRAARAPRQGSATVAVDRLVDLVLGAVEQTVVVALVGGAAWVAAAGGDGETVPVERRDLVVGVDLEGVVEAVDPATLGPPTVTGLWNYRVSFMVPEGTEVRAGQPVLGFDAQELEELERAVRRLPLPVRTWRPDDPALPR